MRIKGSRFLWLLIGLLACLPAQAHKLKVFASAEGDEILGQAYFAGGAPASGALIIVTDGEGQEVARLTPDEAGDFRYRVERRTNYKVTADSRDGHQASWTLQADEFSPSLPGTEIEETATDGSSAAGAVSGPPPVSTQAQQPVATEQIERAVARQIRPLRMALQEHDERVRLRDILGGIGYIIGLAGLALWWQGRRRDGEQ